MPAGLNGFWPVVGLYQRVLSYGQGIRGLSFVPVEIAYTAEGTAFLYLDLGVYDQFSLFL